MSTCAFSMQQFPSSSGNLTTDLQCTDKLTDKQNAMKSTRLYLLH